MKKIIFICLLLFSNALFAGEKITVLLDWFANPTHAPLFVAKDKGFFAEENLDVELIGPSDPSDPPKLVAAGKADIAITYQPQFMQQVDRGLPLILIATLIDKPLNCLTVLRESSIYTIKDLKGKRIGLSTGSMNGVTLETMLKRNGLQLRDVEQMNVHYDLTQALLAKKVDAVTGMMRTFEIIQLEMQGHPARIFLPEENGLPTYSELIFVINKKNVQDPKFTKFVTALKKAVLYLKAHPEETWNDFARTHPALNNPLNHRAWLATIPYFANDPAAFNTKEWQNFAKFMQQHHLIKDVKSINTYALSLKDT